MLQDRHGDGQPHWLRLVTIMLLVLSFTIAGSQELFAQQQNLTVKVNGFSARDWAHAQVVLTVLDGAGHPVSGLTKASFAPRLNGTAVAPVGLSQGIDSSLPLSVVLALDVSGGMQGAALDQAKLATHRFLDGLGPRDTVAVFGFNDAVNLVQPFTQDHTAAGAAIDRLTAGGRPALYQATVQSVLQASASADTGRRAVVVLSDGADASGGQSQQALFAAQALGVPVFTIGLGGGIDRDYLQRLAQVSSGLFTDTSAPEGLVQLYQNVSELLRDQYVLALDASSLGLSTTEPADLSVTATANGSSGSDQRAVCPQRLCVRLTDVASGDKLIKARTVTADVVAVDAVTSVSLYVDGNKTATLTQPPYQFTLDPAQFSGGEHTLAAEVASATASTRSAEVQVRFDVGGGSGSSSSSFVVIGLILVLAAVALLLVVYFFRRRSAGADAPRPVSPQDKPKAGPLAKPRLRVLEEGEGPPARMTESSALLGHVRVVSGSLAGQTFAVGSTPVSIGSGYRSLIRLPRELEQGGEMAPEFARIWVRGNQLMLHELRRLSATGPVGGRWEILEDGDVFSIGPFSFRFGLGTEKPAESAPNVVRGASETIPNGPASEEPVVDILKRHPVKEEGQEAYESQQEGPPRTATAP